MKDRPTQFFSDTSPLYYPVLLPPIWKRLMDIILSIGALLVLAPLVAAIAIYIKIVSPGPVLYRQVRVGYRGLHFNMLKFRTMHVGSNPKIHRDHFKKIIDQNLPLSKLDFDGDTRVIPFGHFFRGTGLDELPQLINVIRGEMSLIGPRPCVPYEYEYFTLQQRERCNAVPGLTGLWQVMGKNSTDLKTMIDYDLFYTRNISLKRDLKILIKTIPAIISQAFKENKPAETRAEVPAGPVS